MRKGKFVTIEGCEGVGKTTQVELLKKALAEKSGAMFLREPGGTLISEKIRSVILDVNNKGMSPVCEVLLYSASRAQLVDEVIKPALERGVTVICDRFTDSTLAYQGYARGLGAETVEELGRIACGGLSPDLTIFLDLDPEAAFSRKGGADKGDRLEMEGLAFHRRVYEGYKRIAEKYPERVVCVPAGENALSVHAKVMRTLEERGVI